MVITDIFAVMVAGKKVTHKLFKPGEYLYANLAELAIYNQLDEKISVVNLYFSESYRRDWLIYQENKSGASPRGTEAQDMAGY